MPTLAETLTSRISDLDYSDNEWVLFVRDHKKNILQNSKTIQIKPSDMFTYRYRVRSLLDFLQIDSNLSWLIMEMNSLKSMSDIVDLTKITIPDNDFMKLLFERFNSFQSASASLS